MVIWEHEGNENTSRRRVFSTFIDWPDIKTRFFYVLYSDKTWVFDQSQRAQGPIYILIMNICTRLNERAPQFFLIFVKHFI